MAKYFVIIQNNDNLNEQFYIFPLKYKRRVNLKYIFFFFTSRSRFSFRDPPFYHSHDGLNTEGKKYKLGHA